MESPFEGPFDGTLHLIQETGFGPGYTIGDIDTLRYSVSIGSLRVLMLTKAIATDTWLPGKKPVTLSEILEVLPSELRHGTISWMMLEGEEEPTTAIIYSGIKTEELKMLTYARLYTSLRKNKSVDSYIKKFREQANSTTLRDVLKDSQPVMSVVVGKDHPDDKEFPSN